MTKSSMYAEQQDDEGDDALVLFGPPEALAGAELSLLAGAHAQ